MTDTIRKILVTDDDAEIRSLLADYLTSQGFAVDVAADAAAARDRLKASRPDLMILDVSMPGEDGLALCRSIRQNDDLPILMLTALDSDADRIDGLESGVDDYLAKPFNPRELVARVRAILRRSGPGPASGPAIFGDWRFDSARQELSTSTGKLLPLSASDTRCLALLVDRMGQPVSREDLMQASRGRELIDPLDRTIDVQLSRLRKKLGDEAKEQRLIRTIRNEGYMLVGGEE